MGHRTHPGRDAGDCPLRIIASGRRSDGGSGGYACDFTGGHCLPGEQCAERVRIAEEEQEEELYV